MGKENPEATEDDPDDVEGKKKTAASCRAWFYFLTKWGET